MPNKDEHCRQSMRNLSKFQTSKRPHEASQYYLKKYVALLIRKTINAVTVMFAVMKIIQQIINAVTVIPVKMYQTISKHIMFRCHCRFLLEI